MSDNYHAEKFFKVAGRNLLRHKTYSLLNVLGQQLRPLSDDGTNVLHTVDGKKARLKGYFADSSVMKVFNLQPLTGNLTIRKVIGTSTAGLVRLLSLDFMLPVLIGNLLSWPLAAWAVHSWLAEFTYRITIGWSVFAVSLILTLTVALLTIGFRCWQMARPNPVRSLRAE